MVAAGDENQSVIVGCQIATSRASESQQFVYDDAFILAVGTVRGEQVPAVAVPHPDGVGKVRRPVWGKQDVLAVDVRKVRQNPYLGCVVAAYEQVAVSTLQPDVFRTGTFEHGNSADSDSASG